MYRKGQAWWGTQKPMREVRKEGQEFKISFAYIASLRLAWTTQDPIARKTKETPFLGACGRELS